MVKKAAQEQTATASKGAKNAEKGPGPRNGGIRKRRGVGVHTPKERKFERFIYKVLKQSYKDLGIQSSTMKALNSILLELYDKFGATASQMSKSIGHQILSPQDVQSAAKLLIPGELQKHAVDAGSQALIRFRKSVDKSD